MDMKNVGNKVSYDPNQIIGNGSYAIVYEGLYENTKKVAVKRILRGQVDEMLIKEEFHIMLKADDHPNILRCLFCEMNDDFIFIVTERCAGTLKDLIEGIYKGPVIEDKKEILRQLTHGLSYLHHLGIIHRDIKPTNILIFAPEVARGMIKPQIKLSDFGISKTLNNGKIDLTNSRGINQNGTRGWMAPEFVLNERYNSKMDIFPLGCVFGYTLTDGKHIFGEDSLRQQIRIEDRLPMILALDDLKIHLDDPAPAFELIKSMTEIKPSKRPTAEKVLQHNFFNESAATIVYKDAASEAKIDATCEYVADANTEVNSSGRRIIHIYPMNGCNKMSRIIYNLKLLAIMNGICGILCLVCQIFLCIFYEEVFITSIGAGLWAAFIFSGTTTAVFILNQKSGSGWLFGVVLILAGISALTGLQLLVLNVSRFINNRCQDQLPALVITVYVFLCILGAVAAPLNVLICLILIKTFIGSLDFIKPPSSLSP